jgi:hypothetical protein
MSTQEVADARQLDRTAVVAWRFQVLLRAGYSWDSATRLAVSPEVDLHVAVELRARGCPEATAVRILV